jgi:hypothetical protein
MIKYLTSTFPACRGIQYSAVQNIAKKLQDNENLYPEHPVNPVKKYL